MDVRSEVGKSREASEIPVFNTEVGPALIFVIAAGLAIVIMGGYGLNWGWTGFKDNNTLWDWLHLMILPITLAAAAFWLSAEGRGTIQWRWWWFVLPVAAAPVLLIGGYVLHWGWTGFQGNKLWDWMHLLVLPLVLVLLPSWMRLSYAHPVQWRLAVGAALVFFVVVTIGGYALNWSWTGFSDNRFWDWLDLLLVPFLVPVAFIFLRKRTEHRREVANAGERHHLPRLTSHGWVEPPPETDGDRGSAEAAFAPSTRQGDDAAPCPHCGRAG